MTPKDPFDDRLRAYLLDRAAAPVPEDLVTNAQRSGRLRPITPRPWLRVAFGLATVVVGVVLVANVVAGPPPTTALPTSTPSSSSSGASALPSSSASDSDLAAGGFPAEVLGLPVITVAKARSLIAAGQHRGQAMAVGGWWSEATLPMGCPAEMVYKSIVEGYCSQTALAPTNAKIDDYRNSTNSSSESFVPPPDALIPRLAPETAGSAEPWKDVPFGSPQRQQPQRVVLIGHSGDPRAWQCVAENLESCKQAFVVDAFAWVEGRSVAAWVDGNGPPQPDDDRARTAAEAAVPGGRLVTLISPGYDLTSLDPRFETTASDGWLARALVGDVDAAGTSRLVEIAIEVVTFQALTFEMRYEPGTEPGGVQTLLGGEPLHSTFAVIRTKSGTVVHEAWPQYPAQYPPTPPAVLEPGDYEVAAWSEPRSETPPQLLGNPLCTGPVHVTRDTVTSMTITWDATDRCTVRPSPDATPH